MMSPERYRQLKENSKKEKLLIGIGCSFTQGQGSPSVEVWEKFNWNIPNDHIILEVEHEEIAGSWVHQICDNHMPDWAPINLGERGGGNRASAKYLTALYPELNLEDPKKEKIVVFMLTGTERYSIVHGDWEERFHGIFRTLWPSLDSDDEVWRAYANFYSEKGTLIENYFAIKEVKDWCKYNNAKLLLVSAFDFSYHKDYMPISLKSKIDVNFDLNLWLPEGHPSVFHMLLDKDGFGYNIQNGGYWSELNYSEKYPKGTEHVSRCCHPNLKGHAVIAEKMFEELNRREFFDSL